METLDSAERRSSVNPLTPVTPPRRLTLDSHSPRNPLTPATSPPRSRRPSLETTLDSAERRSSLNPHFTDLEGGAAPAPAAMGLADTCLSTLTRFHLKRRVLLAMIAPIACLLIVPWIAAASLVILAEKPVCGEEQYAEHDGCTDDVSTVYLAACVFSASVVACLISLAAAFCNVLCHFVRPFHCHIARDGGRAPREPEEEANRASGLLHHNDGAAADAAHPPFLARASQYSVHIWKAGSARIVCSNLAMARQLWGLGAGTLLLVRSRQNPSAVSVRAEISVSWDFNRAPGNRSGEGSASEGDDSGQEGGRPRRRRSLRPAGGRSAIARTAARHAGFGAQLAIEISEESLEPFFELVHLPFTAASECGRTRVYTLGEGWTVSRVNTPSTRPPTVANVRVCGPPGSVAVLEWTSRSTAEAAEWVDMVQVAIDVAAGRRGPPPMPSVPPLLGRRRARGGSESRTGGGGGDAIGGTARGGDDGDAPPHRRPRRKLHRQNSREAATIVRRAVMLEAAMAAEARLQTEAAVMGRLQTDGVVVASITMEI